jgi:hypothetical protein
MRAFLNVVTQCILVETFTDVSEEPATCMFSVQDMRNEQETWGNPIPSASFFISAVCFTQFAHSYSLA